MTLAGNVMAPTTVSATAFLGAVLPIPVGKTLLIAVLVGPAPRARALAVERVASGPILALAIHLAISAPFTQRALCSYGKVKNKSPLCLRRSNQLFILVGVQNCTSYIHIYILPFF